MNSKFRMLAVAGATIGLTGTIPVTAATVSDACPATMAQAQALLQRRGRITTGAGGYPHRYSPARLTVLGVPAVGLSIAFEPNALWSFSYALRSAAGASPRRAFAESPPTLPGFTYNCPANGQCYWRAPGFGNEGPRPQHVVGQLLEVDLRNSYADPSSYSLACIYLNRRPVRG